MTEEITPDPLLEQIARASTVAGARGAALPSRYAVRRVLGEGGFGVVYEVFDEARDEALALKTLHRVAPEAQLRFKREFRALVDLRHPHLVRLHELGGEGRHLWFTMELVGGARDLDAWIAGDPDRLRRGLAQLASGLAALHAAGVLHRDLKPSNVLVGEDGRVVLVDFGLARDATADGSTRLAGTPLYMAPEQCAEAPLTRAVDLYAVGVLIFHALTGRHPFEGKTVELMVDKQQRDAPSLAELAPDAPADLVALADRLLARDPAARPTAAELVAALGEGSPEARAEDDEPFVGREAERARLAARVAAREGAFVRVVGPSGIGKTALLERAARDWSPDTWVLRGRCHPRESVPYKAFDEVVDQLARRLEREPDAGALLPRDLAALQALFPVLRVLGDRPRDGDALDRSRGLAALRELFARLADRHPVVLVIDDLQWGDSDSARLLVELLRQPDAPRVTVLGTQRSEDRGALVDQLEALLEGEVELTRDTLALGPLSVEDAHELAAQLVGDASRIRSVVEAAGGHPFFLAEFARGGDEESLDALIDRRTAEVPEAERRVLYLLAAAGHVVSLEALRVLFGEAPPELDPLLAARLVRVGPEGARVYHDRIAERLLAPLSAERVGAIRRELAEALITLDGDPEQIAAHLIAARDARATTYLERAAARSAAAFAHRSAAALYEQAIALRRREGAPDGALRELALARARSLDASGHASEAAPAFLDAAARCAGAESRAMRARAARYMAFGGDVDGALTTFREALAELGVRLPRGPTEALARATVEMARGWVRRLRPPRDEVRDDRLDVLWQAYYPLLFVRPALGLAVGSMHVAEAARGGTPAHRFRAACIQGFGEVARRGARARAEALASVARAYSELGPFDDLDAELDHHFVVGLIRYFGLDLAGAVEPFRACVEAAEAMGRSFALAPALARTMISTIHFVLGDMGASREFASRLLVEMSERGHTLGWVLVAYHYWWARVTISGALDDHRVGRAQIDARFAARDDELQGWWARLAAFNLQMIADEPERAYREISLGLVDGLRLRAVATRFHDLEARCNVARGAIAVAVVDPARRRSLTREARSIADALRDEPSAWSLALAKALDAGLTSLEPGADVVRALRACASAADAAGMKQLAALARTELVARVDDPEAARAADRFFEGAGIRDRHLAARYWLPGRFFVTGRADAP